MRHRFVFLQQVNPLQILLLPFSLLYGLVVWVRNLLYDFKIIPSQPFDFPIIGVGNLSAGGTGKTPQIEYLIRLLSPITKVATLSRGYGRLSSGYLHADETCTAREIGDEPMQILMKHADVNVFVCEKRLYAIPNMLYDAPETGVILLDDAFQHRAIKPGLSILLTPFDEPFFEDFLLPSGNLREWRKGYRRADIILVTKCPKNLSASDRKKYFDKINPQPGQQVFFTFEVYDKLRDANTGETINGADLKNHSALVFSGIANSKGFDEYCLLHFKTTLFKSYTDHHRYRKSEIEELKDIFEFKLKGENKIMITTEKDYMRLVHTERFEQFKPFPLYYLPIKTDFFEEDKAKFDALILKFLDNYSITKHHL